MPDLNARVEIGHGRSLILPAVPVLFPNAGILVEGVRASETAGAVLTVLRGLPAAEAIRASANTVSRILGNTGQVAFVAQSDHASNTNYTARVRVFGSSTVVATQNLGVPTPDGNSVIIVDLSATFAGLPAGNYTVSIFITAPGGTTDSAESTAFSLPLS